MIKVNVKGRVPGKLKLRYKKQKGFQRMAVKCGSTALWFSQPLGSQPEHLYGCTGVFIRVSNGTFISVKSGNLQPKSDYITLKR